MSGLNDSSSTSNDLAYDLRQRYAKLVADHLDYIAEVRNDFPKYFKGLQNVYNITKHKIEKKDKKKDNKEATYESLVKEFIIIANKHSEAYLGKSNSSEAIAKIQTALNNIEQWLWKGMDKAGMFGSKRNIEGLK